MKQGKEILDHQQMQKVNGGSLPPLNKTDKNSFSINIPKPEKTLADSLTVPFQKIEIDIPENKINVPDYKLPPIKPCKLKK